MSQIKETFNNVLNYANTNINSLMQSEQNYIIITFVIVFFILFSLISWIYSKLIIQNQACTKLNNFYNDGNPFRTTTFMQNENDAKVHNVGNINSCLFLIFYGFFRIIAEQFREPDFQLGYLFGNLSMGTMLSFIMVISGFVILIILKKKNEV